jgi:hypothetical protein
VGATQWVLRVSPKDHRYVGQQTMVSLPLVFADLSNPETQRWDTSSRAHSGPNCSRSASRARCEVPIGFSIFLPAEALHCGLNVMPRELL